MRRQGADVLVRLTWNSLRLTDPGGQPLDWTALFKTASADGPLDMPVQVRKSRGAFTPLPMRLVMIMKPPQAASRAHPAARKASRKDQRSCADPRTLAAADHLILLTSLPKIEFRPDRLGTLYRVRWQIEWG